MATIELTSLTEILDEDDIATLSAALAESDAPPLDLDDDQEPAVIHAGLDDDIFTDFVDRLDANDASADVYLPADFEDTFEVSEFRFGSAHALLLALESLREEFDVEEDDENLEEDEDAGLDDDDDVGFDTMDGEDEPYGLEEGDAGELKDDHLRLIWQVLRQGAKASIRRGVVLLLKQ